MDQSNIPTDLWSTFPLLDFPDGTNLHGSPTFDLWDFHSGLGSLLSEGDNKRFSSKRSSVKSFTGCVTCRQRKIKCDERRPFCSNCEKSRHHQCQGYVDDVPNQRNNKRSGRRKRARLARIVEANSSEQLLEADYPEGQTHAADHNSAVVNGGRFQDFTIIANQEHEITQIVEPASREPNFIESEDHVSRDNTEDQISQEISLTQLISRPVQIDDADIDLLVYFQKTVCPIMLPSMDAGRNPWLQVYMPMALCKEATVSRAALRHALMSVAASHLTQKDEAKRIRYHERARYHQNEAMKIIENELEQNLTDIRPFEKYTILAAALTLITTHIWGHDRTDCQPFVNLAKRLARATGGENFWKSSTLSTILFQLLRIYDLVAATAQLQLDSVNNEEEVISPESISPVGVDADEGGHEDQYVSGSQVSDGSSGSANSSSVPYILDSSFGISSQTMSLLHEIVRLGSLWAAHSASPTVPESLLAATDAVATRLYSIEQDKGAFGADRTSTSLLPPTDTELALFGMRPEKGAPQEQLPKPVMEEVMENYQRAFHYAVVLYFQRVTPQSYFTGLLEGNESRCRQIGALPVATENCQLVVRKLYDCLENIDCLTDCTKVRPSIALWPAFIAAVEAIDVDLRHRALIWFSKAAKKGIGNIPRAKALVMSSWRATDRRIYGESSVDRGLSPVDWRRVMKESGEVIMLA